MAAPLGNQNALKDKVPRDRTIVIRVSSQDLQAWDEFAKRHKQSRNDLIIGAVSSLTSKESHEA